jgi:glutamine synthetase adenylyltransferase
MTDLDHLITDLPDPDSARRFIASLEELHPRDAAKLRKNEGLLSDVLTLAAYSPLLSTTLLQNPDYLWWLNRKRRAPAVRTKDELLEALGRFMLTHSQIDLHTQLARFRRRELLRIFLGDIRRLATIAEITEDISNLADAILETALRAARQEMDNRSGSPQMIDDKGRKTTAEFCIVSLGKLGSHELNYSSDIDLLFLYSAEGETSGGGTHGSVTNREYFVKLGETVTRIVGKQVGEGAAYRIDMRLRPHGRVGPLAISVADAVRYYESDARDWERQVLIRSRASAGEARVYRDFFDGVQDTIYKTPVDVVEGTSVRAALENVRQSKQLIDREQKPERGLNVKLGRGGIREIEFIAQALQLAYGGSDRWLRVSHTLISLSRLADRRLITESELTELFNAYEFLRRLEHVLQMENGLQTHTVPEEAGRRELVARRMRCSDRGSFDVELESHRENVHRVFLRVFDPDRTLEVDAEDPAADELTGWLEPHETPVEVAGAQSPHLRDPGNLKEDVSLDRDNYLLTLRKTIDAASDFRHRLGAFRQQWRRLRDRILDADKGGDIDIPTAKRAQTALAEASIEIALDITRTELEARYHARIDSLGLAVMGLGKLGGGAIDYESDLDLVLVYDETRPIPVDVTAGEFYSRAAEVFVTTLSSMTRDGSIYRVDLRLRPYGKNGTSTISAHAFREYIRDNAVAWEWLAYVRIRGVGGDIELAQRVERELRDLIYARASGVPAGDLAAETRRMRMLLEKQRGGRMRGKEVDIKYGQGGMLDVYFAMRYLQLRDGIPDSANNRSTEHMLGVLHDRGSLSDDEHENLIHGYRFLSILDHELRLAAGRTTRLPLGNLKALETVSRRMNLESPADLIEQLSLHRMNVRASFNSVLGSDST